MIRNYILICTIFFLFSCETQRIQISKNPNPDKNQVYSNLKEVKKIPKNIQLKGTASIYQEEKNIKLSVNIKAQRDSVFWCSVSGPLNIELFRILLTKDSLFVLDRINKTFYKKTEKEIKEYLNSSASLLEVQSFLFAKPMLTKNHYIKEELDTSIVIISKQKNKSSRYIIDKNNLNILSVILSEEKMGNKNTFRLDYLEHNVVEEYILPKKFNITLDAIIKSRKEQFTCIIDFSKSLILEKQDFIFNIPNSYVQAD